MASHRPAVVFGISYRGEMGRDMGSSDAMYMSSASKTMANAPPPPPSLQSKQYQNHQQQQQQQPEYLVDTFADRYGEPDGGTGRRGENDVVPFGDTLGCREVMCAPQDDSKSLQRAHQGDGGDAPTSRLRSSRTSMVDVFEGRDDCTLSLPAIMTTNNDGETTTRRAEDGKSLLVNSDGDSSVRRRATEAHEGRGGAPAESPVVGLKRNELVDSWLLDVRLETETAGTALRVSATARCTFVTLGVPHAGPGHAVTKHS